MMIRYWRSSMIAILLFTHGLFACPTCIGRLDENNLHPFFEEACYVWPCPQLECKKELILQYEEQNKQKETDGVNHVKEAS